MAKQLNKTLHVDLLFDANTSAVLRELQSLDQQLSMISKTTNLDLGLAEDITKASYAAAELQAHLKQAMNTKTGTLDFTKLNQSIKKSGSSIQEYSQQLRALGPAGQQAFVTLTKAVASAEIPMRRTSLMAAELWNTLKNTARWQLSSSVLHGFMSTLQGAYGYAQDLNESLNNIRIVTGANVEEMARFAEEANKAAKALSTTTTEYTNASLIYFQQGLNEKQVKERADITIKMANVSRQSAEMVSDQMTAVWNNFYDGSKSLEYYADVMTALGAATASSTEEISEGLEKFAAIADTVGLSFDYAASALATVTATTRQSADVVGTAFKTLFARIQDLELGKTLDDGTSLGKYSQALNTVGISIKDASGGLKKMDDILDELGGKWQSLTKDTQVSVAQTVAGIRQYTQLMALMNNWDFMKQNLNTTRASMGALQEQADIYAESWEAANARVKAAAESIFSEILDDNVFIGALNSIANIIEGIDTLIDRMGGLSGVLSTLGLVLTQVFSQQLSQGLSNMAHNLKMMTTWGKQAEKDTQNQIIADAVDSVPSVNEFGDASFSEKAEQSSMRSQLQMQQAYNENAERMSVIERDVNKAAMDRVKLLRDQVVELEKQRELAVQNIDAAQNQLRVDVQEFNLNNQDGPKLDTTQVDGYIRQLKEAVTTQDTVTASLQKLETHGAKAFDSVKQSLLQSDVPMDQLSKEAIESATDIESLKSALQKLNIELNNTQAKASHELKNVVSPQAAQHVDNLTQATRERAKATREAKEMDEQANKAQETAINRMQAATGAQKSWADTLVSSANAAMALASALSMISQIVDTINDPNIDAWDKFQSVLMTVAMLIPTLVMGFKALNDIVKTATGVDIIATAVKKLKTKATRDSAQASREEAAATNQATQEQKKNTAADVQDEVVEQVSKKRRGKNDPPVFKGRSGKLRQFAGHKDGKPVDQYGDRIGVDFYKQAGLDESGNLVKTPKSGGGAKGALKSAFGKGTGFSAGSFALAVGVAAAIVAIAAVRVNELNKAFNANEIAAQKAEEAAKNLGEEYSKATQKYEDLNNTLSNYDSAKKGLSDLTRGTAEFTAEITKANDEALKLLDSYGELIGNRYSVDENGLIQIDEEALEDIKKQEANKMIAAQSASIVAKREAREARAIADATELNRKKMRGSDGGFTGEDANRTGAIAATGMGAGAVAGLTAGAIAGSAVPVLGTAIGALAGLVVGAIGGGISMLIANNSETDAEKEAINKLADAYAKNGASAITAAEIAKAYNMDVADVTQEQIDAIRDLCKEMHENTLATEAENRAMAAQVLADNEKVQQSRDAADVAVFAGDVYGKETEAAYNKYMSDDYQANFFGVGSDEQKAAWAEYAKSQGLDKLKNYKITNYKTDGSVVYTYTDENNQKQKKTISQEEWAAVLAAQEADDQTNKAANNIVDILNNLDKETVSLLSSAKKQDLSALKIGELADPKSRQAIEAMTEDDLHALGFEGTKAEILKGIAEQQAKSLQDIKDSAKAYGSAVSDLVDNIISSNDESIRNITQSTLKEYSGTLGELMLHGSEEAMSDFDSGLQGILDNYSHKSEEIMSLANSIDWSKGEDALQDFNAQLMAMGINVNENSEEWKSMISAMQQINTSVVHRDLDSIRNEITNIKDLAEKIEIGSVISDGDYKQLIAYKAELADLFLMTADGYKFIGGGDVQKIAQQAALDKLEKTKTSNQDAINVYNALNAWGWKDEAGNFTKEDWYGMANGTDSYEMMASMTKALTNSDSGKKAIANLGLNAEFLKEMASLGADATEEQKKAAKEQMQKLYQEILVLNANKESGVYDDTAANEVYLSTATELQQLKDMAKNAKISTNSDEYNKAFRGLANEAYAQATSMDELRKVANDVTRIGGSRKFNSEDYKQHVKRITEANAETATSLRELDKVWHEGDMSGDLLDQEVYIKNVKRITEENAKSAKSIKELQKVWADGSAIKGVTLDSEVYREALIGLGEGYETTKDELAKYQEALEGGDTYAIKNTQIALENAILLEEIAAIYGLTIPQIKEATTTLQEAFDSLSNDDMALNQYLLDLTDAAEELNISFDELLQTVTNINTMFSVTADEALDLSKTIHKTAQSYDLSADSILIQAKALEKTNKALGMTAKSAINLASQNQRMNKGLITLTDNWATWRETLNEGNITSMDYANTVADLTSVIKELVGATEDLVLPTDFFNADNIDLITQAASGSVNAINALGIAVAQTSIKSLEASDELARAVEDTSMADKFDAYFDDGWQERFQSNVDIVQTGLDALFKKVKDGTITIGEEITTLGSDWVTAFNEMVIQAGLSAEEVNNLLNQMGVETEVNVETIETVTQVPKYKTTEEITEHDDGHREIISWTEQIGTVPVTGEMEVATINDKAKVNYIGNGGLSGSTTDKITNNTKRADPIKNEKSTQYRYTAIDESIEDVDERIQKAETLLDAANDAEADALRAELAELYREREGYLKDKEALAGGYETSDAASADVALKALFGSGYSVYDAKDNVNIDIASLYDKYYNQRQHLVDNVNKANADPYASAESIEKATEALEDYDAKWEEFARWYEQWLESGDIREEAKELQNFAIPDYEEFDADAEKLEYRYADINKELERMAKATQKASDAADKLYGAKRAAAMSHVNASLTSEIRLLQTKIAKAKEYLKAEQKLLITELSLAAAAMKTPIEFKFATDGSIANMEAVMTALSDTYAALIQSLNDAIAKAKEDGMITAAEQANLDALRAGAEDFKKQYESVINVAKNYNDTLEQINNSYDEIADKQDEIKSNNYEILSTKLSYALDMTNAELQRIDYQLNKVSDDIYKMGEAAGILSQKVGVGQDALAAYTTHMNDLNSAYQQGYIHESDYVAGLQEVRDGMYSELGALQDLDKEMMNYYGETLSAASEEIGKYTDRMDSLNSVLDHYQSLMILIGKETDYKAMGIVLQGAADTARNSLAVAQATAEFYAKQAAEKKLLMENAIEGSKAFELYKKEWEAAEAASREAKENMLAKTQEWAEREKAVIENNFKDFKKSLEEALTGGSTFDYLSTQMERSVSLQEEYLTATNQIYETTKMINTAQKAIDQTTNTAAKRELQSFIQKTEQLKNQNKLSKYELDLHQAQYQILQAQIALEEAQNAKSTVRLRRDSEGNFGYVYTADTSKIADAEQKLADAQNAYYNKSLEGANKYVQNYTETLRNMQDELTALTDAWMQGEIQSEEEYNRRKEEIVQFYGEKLKQYSHLYQVAISADSRAVADAWSTDYADMIADTKDWQEKVDGYAGACIESMHKWQGVVATVQLTTGASYDEIAEKVHSVVTESEALVTAITDPANGVIQAMQKQLEAVSGVTAKYAAQGRELDALISKVEEYIISIDAMIAKIGQANNITLTDPSTAAIDGGGGSSGSGNTTTNNNNNGSNNSNSQNTSNSTESDSNVASYQTGKLSWYDDLQKGRIWTDSAGNTYSEDSVIGQKIQAAFDRAWKAAGQKYKGAWYLGWKNLNADELHEKYGLSTGGYTGDWAGPMGKLAFLHQKEIVLNKDDTANLLAAVDMLRTILHTLDVHSMSAQLGGILSTPGFHMGDSGTLEQNVKIEASFPNVQDHNEIEEAFNNLINKASQYANRK